MHSRLFLAALMAVLLVAPATAAPVIAYPDVRIFDGEKFLTRQTILIEGETIIAVGPASRVKVPRGAHVKSCGSVTLLPGLIDAHVHIGFSDPIELLRGGLTTVRDLGWPADKLVPLAKNLDGLAHEGPQLLFSGPMFTARGGYPSRAGWAPAGTALEIDTISQALAMVRTFHSRGIRVIKVAQEPKQGPVLSLRMLRAIVVAAHELGMKVTSHCGSLDELRVALAAEVDELAHGLWSDERIPDDVLTRMVKQKMIVIPTLAIDPSPARIENLRRFLKAGGRVIYGTDKGNRPSLPAIDVEEMSLMRTAGMSIPHILASATSEAARHLGLQTRGRIAVGMTADLIVVPGNASVRLVGLKQPLAVMRRGKIVFER